MAHRSHRMCLVIAVVIGALALAPQHSSAAVGTGTISGVVSDAVSGVALVGMQVAVFDANLDRVRNVSTADDGRFAVVELPASAAGYSVCVAGVPYPLRTSPTGYPGQCWSGVSWDADSYWLPTAARRIPVAADTVGRIEIAMPPGGAISGHVAERASGLAIADADVDVMGLWGERSGHAYTDEHGDFSVVGLPAGPQRVCAYADQSSSGSPRYGLVDQCYRGVATPGTWGYPAGITPVTVSSGAVRSGLHIELGTHGVLSGIVRDDAGRGIDSVDVVAFDADGTVVASELTSRTGTWKLALAPSRRGYAICVGTEQYNATPSPTGYVPQCTGDVAWDGNYFDAPAHPDRVPVVADWRRWHIDFTMQPGGAIGGTLRSPATGAPIKGDWVTVYTPDGDLVSSDVAATGRDGTYVVPGLPPSETGYVVCFDAREHPPHGGESPSFVAQCYPNVPRPGSALPSSTTPVPVRAGKTTSRINGEIVKAAALSGHASSSAGGLIENVRVSAFDPVDHTRVEQETTYPLRNGPFGYLLRDLAPSSTGYLLCFDGADSLYGGSAGGQSAECYPNKPWDGRAANIPADAEPVPVPTSGYQNGKINAVLDPRGGLSGMVTAYDTGRTLQNVVVSAFSVTGVQVGESAVTLSTGVYRLGGLVSGNYTVCFDARHAFGSHHRRGIRSACTGDVSWTPGHAPPAGATTVPVVVGEARDGVDIRIRSFWRD
jgi:hypothetical protein